MEEDANPRNAQPEVAQVQLGAAEAAPVLPRNALKPNTASRENALALEQKPQPTKLLQPDNSTKGELVMLDRNNPEQAQPKQANTVSPILRTKSQRARTCGKSPRRPPVMPTIGTYWQTSTILTPTHRYSQASS